MRQAGHATQVAVVLLAILMAAAANPAAAAGSRARRRLVAVPATQPGAAADGLPGTATDGGAVTDHGSTGVAATDHGGTAAPPGGSVPAPEPEPEPAVGPGSAAPSSPTAPSNEGPAAPPEEPSLGSRLGAAAKGECTAGAGRWRVTERRCERLVTAVRLALTRTGTPPARAGVANGTAEAGKSVAQGAVAVAGAAGGAGSSLGDGASCCSAGLQRRCCIARMAIASACYEAGAAGPCRPMRAVAGALEAVAGALRGRRLLAVGPPRRTLRQAGQAPQQGSLAGGTPAAGGLQPPYVSLALPSAEPLGSSLPFYKVLGSGAGCRPLAPLMPPPSCCSSDKQLASPLARHPALLTARLRGAAHGSSRLTDSAGP